MKVKNIIELLEAHGVIHKRTKGDHRQYRMPGDPIVITVSCKLNVDMPAGAFADICRDSGIEEIR